MNMDKQQKQDKKRGGALILALMSVASFILLDVPSILEKYFSDKTPAIEENIETDENDNENIESVTGEEGLSEQNVTQNIQDSAQDKENILDNVIKQAEAVFNSEGYENAILVLKDAIKTIQVKTGCCKNWKSMRIIDLFLFLIFLN